MKLSLNNLNNWYVRRGKIFLYLILLVITKYLYKKDGAGGLLTHNRKS